MNPIDVAPSLAAPAERDGVSVFPQSERWSSLVTEAGRFGVAVDRMAEDRLTRYRELLMEWSGRMNLTAIRDPAEIERRLFLDALALVPLLDAQTPRPYGQSHPSLIDIGTGAGFPGLVLKILRPSLAVTLVDATAKKVAFLRTVIAQTGLDGVHAVHGRAEELGRDHAYRDQFDLATARAVASLPVLVEYLIPLLRVGGTAILPKGADLGEELRAGQRAARLLHAEIVSDNLSPIPTTRLVVVRKTGPTPPAYPRRTGVPSHEPLAGGG